MSNINFTNTGFKEAEQKKKEISNNSSLTDKQLIGIKIPLQRGLKSNESLFAMNDNVIDQVSNNFKSFLLTKKGELLCKPDFGLTISEIYNRTDLSQEEIEEIAMQEIRNSTAKYFPYIILKDFESILVKSNNVSEPDYVKVEIRYNIQGFENKTNTISLAIRRSI